MPLTPADVHNVAFSKPPIGKRGYNEDEVDAFLDLVENELTRLIEENADLRQRVAELDQEVASGRAGGGAQSTQAIPLYEPAPDRPAASLRRRSPSTRRPRLQRGDRSARTSTSGPPRCWAWPRTPPTG